MDKIAGRGSQTLRLLDGTVLGAPDLFGAPMDDDRFDWKVGIETDVAQKSLLYANVQTGYLQGGFTPPPSDMITTFEPAKLLAFNLGAKNRFLGDRLQINDEFFFYDYDDYQITFTRPPAAAITINAAKAEIYGNQLDIDFLPARGTELFLNATWLHAEYTKFVDPLPPFQDLEGFQLQLSPTLSGTAGLQQQWWLGRGGVLAARAEVYYNDGFWGTYNHVPNTYQSSYTRTDVTLTYTTDDEKWSVSAYVNNIEDEAVYPNLTAAGTGEILSTISLPRTYGVRMAVRFSE
jgi:iron complex outermembrane receptor protein